MQHRHADRGNTRAGVEGFGADLEAVARSATRIPRIPAAEIEGSVIENVSTDNPLTPQASVHHVPARSCFFTAAIMCIPVDVIL